MEPLEREWIRRAQQGDLKAFEELVIRHDGYIMRVIQNMVPAEDAEDLYQETFIKAFNGLNSFRKESEFRTWLTRIAINQCLNHRRAQRWKRWVPLQPGVLDEEDPKYELSSGEIPPDQRAIEKEMWDHLRVVMQELPGSQRAAFVLKYMQDCTIREAARILGKAEGTVKSDLFRAMQKIKLRMQQIYV